MEYKDIQGDSELDSTARRVTVVLSEMGGLPDLQNDIIDVKAYDRTLKDRGSKIFFLRDHDTSIAKGLIGRFKSLYVDNNRLIGVADIPNTSVGDEMLELYKTGVINAHSVGFQAVNTIKGKSGAPNIIKELKLFEGSACLFPANTNTPTLSVGKSLFKSLDTAKDIVFSAEELFGEFDEFFKEVKSGYPSDNKELLEIKNDQWKLWVKRLVLCTQAIHEIPGSQKDEKLIAVLKNANTLFKKTPVYDMPRIKMQASFAGR